MIFDFNPWRLDVDVESTKQLYKEMDYSIDKMANADFIKSLSSENAVRGIFFFLLFFSIL